MTVQLLQMTHIFRYIVALCFKHLETFVSWIISLLFSFVFVLLFIYFVCKRSVSAVREVKIQYIFYNFYVRTIHHQKSRKLVPHFQMWSAWFLLQSLMYLPSLWNYEIKPSFSLLYRVGATRVVVIIFMPLQTLIIHKILWGRISRNGCAG